jgi:hypothetical protein
MSYISALMALLSLISRLIGLFVKSPEAKRQEAVLSIHEAITKAHDTGGNTADIERLIK